MLTHLDSAVQTLRWRLLWHDVEVTTNHPATHELLARMHPAADQELPDSSDPLQLHLRIVDHGAAFQLWLGDDLAGTAPDAAAAAAVGFALVQRTAFGHAADLGWTRVHGVLADRDGCRIVAVGPSGVGKTTLALALMASGWRVGGDESFVTRNGRALAVPRRFQVKAGSPTLPAAAHRWVEEADVLAPFPDLRLLDPTVAGPWRLEVAPIDHVVILARSGVESVLESASTAAALGVLGGEIFLDGDRRPSVAKALSTLLCTARLHRLQIGSDGAAVCRLTERLI